MFIYGDKTTFISKDINQLKNLGFKINKHESGLNKSLLFFIINRVRELIFMLKNIYKSNYLIIWFNDYHAIIPLIISRLFNIKSLLIIGGYDAIKFKKISHGIFSRNRFKLKFLEINLFNVDNIWAVDKSLINGCNNAYKLHGVKSGIRNFINKKIDIQEVHTGYDSKKWKYYNGKKENIILTVGVFKNEKTLIIKNIKLFIELAYQLPKYKFLIVGDIKNIIEKKFNLPKNLIVEGFKQKEELKAIYIKSKFYFQGSILEGLPNVLCESMLCGCIPIGNNVFGIPNAIGNTGLVFNGENDLNNIVKFINENNSDPIQIRNRIINLYNLKKREKAFKNFLN